MKNFSKILFSLLCILGFATTVKAASYSSTITAYASNTKYEYIEGDKNAFRLFELHKKLGCIL